MRLAKVVACLSLSASLLASCDANDSESAAPAAEVKETKQADLAKPPPRKPGLWEMAVNAGGVQMVLKQCIDVAVEKQLSWAWGNKSDTACPEQSVTPGPNGVWNIHSVCDHGERGKVVSNGTASGDVKRRYEVKIDTTITGAAVAAMDGPHTNTVVGEWKGPCPVGWKPGETEVNGHRINVGGS